jgi:hypothetical protein
MSRVNVLKSLRYLLAGLTVFAAQAAFAEPYLAVQSGLKCAQCHVNPTGGGLRTVFGNMWAQTQLAEKKIGPAEDVWTGQVGKFLSVGGNVRANYSFNRVPNQQRSNGFDLQEARLYLDMALVPNRLSVYLDERMAPGNADNLEANVRLWLKPGSLYVKAGQFYLPFGWRLEDDNAYVRQLSGVSMQTPDRGLEIGFEQGMFNGQMSVSNGTAGGPETDDGKQVTARFEYVPGAPWRVGVSVMHNNVPASVGNRTGYGGFAGYRWGKFSFLGEIDFIDDKGIGANGREQVVSFAEANFRMRQGHNLKLSYEWLDPDRDVSEDGQTRTSLLYEWSPMEFVQARFGFRYFHGIPQNDFQNRRELFVQLHGYF